MNYKSSSRSKIAIAVDETGLLILALMVISLFFRLYGLSDKVIWHDEVATRVLVAGSTIAAQIHGLYNANIYTVSEVLSYQELSASAGLIDLVKDLAQRDPQHPPLYYLTAKIWAYGFGYSIYALRSLSVTFSLFCVIAMYWLMRELQSSQRTALIAMLLLGLSPMFILYGQEAREYSMWCLEILLSSAALLKALRIGGTSNTNTQKHWLLYLLCTLAAMYTSFSTLSLILVQTLYIATRARFRLCYDIYWFIGCICIAGLLFLPWVLNLLENFHAFSVSMAWASVIVIPRTAVIRIMTLNFSRNLFDFWPDAVQDQLLPILAATGGLLLVICALICLSKYTYRETRIYILYLVLLPTAMLLVPDLLWGGIRSSNARYLMPAWIGVIAALAFMLGHKTSIRNLNIASALTLAAVLTLAGVTNILHAQQAAPWTKSLSINLPTVAALINRTANPLVIGNQERHHPGNLFALANLLRSDAKMQFVPIEMEKDWHMPRHTGPIYLYSPTDQFRHGLENNSRVGTRLLAEDLFIQLWQVESLPISK